MLRPSLEAATMARTVARSLQIEPACPAMNQTIFGSATPASRPNARS
jgi:hypothetical protein